jgi:chromosome segregation protein
LLEIESKKQIANSKLNILEAEIKKTAEEKGSLEHELALYSADPKDIGALVAKLTEEKVELERQKIEKEKEIKSYTDKINNFNREEEEKKQRVFALQDAMQKKQNKVNEILAKRSDLKVEAAKLDTKQDALAEEVRAELSAAIESVIEAHPAVAEGDHVVKLADEIQKLKYQLSLIGGIDAEVVGEYQQSKERFDFLSDQIRDLRAALADLEKMVEELDEIMKKKRSASFKKIRKEFDRYIKILFAGGDGDIYEVYGEQSDDEGTEQVDGLPPAEQGSEDKKHREKILTGIEISINPPGKKVKNISTLSGGERTLASIALICAILSYNPSPFVVLDEVEAALDETNTRRFAEIVTELSNKSQFIIISHNRVTMHAADALYGVVMNNDGISKLLSVKLEQVPEYTEAAPKA